MTLLLRSLLAGWICAALFSTLPIFAQHMNAEDSPCAGPMSGAEETACFAAAYNRADAKLNSYYRRIETALYEDELNRLKTAQRLWIQYRDANCEAEYTLYAGGSAAPMVKESCLEATTRLRMRELEVMYGWRLEKFGK